MTVVSGPVAASGTIRRRSSRGPRPGAARRRALRVGARGAGPIVAAVASAPAPARQQRRQQRDQARHDGDRHPPDREAEAAVLRLGEDRRARRCASSSARICCLVSPCAMSRRIAARSWSARSDSAMLSGTLHVSHITSSSTSLNDARGCAPSAAARGQREQRQQRDQRRARISPPAPGRWRATRKSWRDLAARHRHDVAGLVEHEGLGQLRGPVLRREVEPVVAQARVGELVLLARSRATRRRRPCRSRRAPCRRCRPACAGRARAPAPRSRTARTTRPRSSARRPCRAARPATAVAAPSSTGSVTPAPGAAGRCPLRTAESSDVSSRRATTP